MFKMIELFDGKVTLNPESLSNSDIETLIKYKEELLEYQNQKQKELAAKRAQEERKQQMLGRYRKT